jgi:prevent-host-death family protein
MAQSDEPTWSVAEAKAHFSDVVERAVGEGPQVVTRRGRRTVVVVSVEEWERRTQRRGSLAEFFAASPLHDSGLTVDRSADTGRAVDL